MDDRWEGEKKMADQQAARKLMVHVAALLGGEARLARRLGMSERVLNRFVTGQEAIPDSLFLRVVDLLLEEASPRKPPSSHLGALFPPDPKRDR